MKMCLLSCLFVLVIAPNPVQAQQPITLEDCFEHFRFYPKSEAERSYTADGFHYTAFENGNLSLFEVETEKKVRVLVPEAALRDIGEISGYWFSANLQYALLQSNAEPVYRHSVVADYWVVHTTTGVSTALNPGEKIQYAVLSPNGDAVAFVVRNNLVYRNLLSGVTTPVTRDGLINQVRNGIPDWVYEEEFSPVSGEGMVATRWSPDGTMLAYLRFDESESPEHVMHWYTGDTYPEQTRFRYPKVGAANSVVKVQIFNCTDGSTVEAMGIDPNDYVPRINWTPDNRLVVTRLNRYQDTLQLLLALPGRLLTDEEAGKSYQAMRLLLEETDPAYVELHDDLYFLENGESFLWTSERSGFKRLYLQPMSGETPRPLTPEGLDLTTFYGLDEQTGEFHYQVAAPTPMERQVWTGNLSDTVQRLLSRPRGTTEAFFCPNYKFYTLTWSDANTPPQGSLYKKGGQLLQLLSDPADLEATRKRYGFVRKDFFNFPLPDGTLLNGWMMKPDSLDAGRKYPVLFDIYGGPGSQTVLNQYDGFLDPWRQLLVKRGIVVVSVDNRGTGGRGAAFKKCTQLQLGNLETADQVAAARYLGALDFIDTSRIGIWGWSYGGYLSTSCILKGNDVFKMAVAVAPVTNWKWYDTAYTERFMHGISDNAEGYDGNSPIHFAHRLKGDNYLICHGTADDNVHFQHTAELIQALIKANKQFEIHYYPNRNHSIAGDNATMHLFTKITHFIQSKL